MKKRVRKQEVSHYIDLEDVFQKHATNRDMDKAKAVLLQYRYFTLQSPGLYERLLLDCRFTDEDELMPWLEMIYGVGVNRVNGFPYRECGEQKWWRVFMWLTLHVPLVVKDCPKDKALEIYLFQIGYLLDSEKLPKDVLEHLNTIC
jgi:hypothetical protein